MNKALQKTSGLKTAILQPASYQPEIVAYGEAVNLQPLLEKRSRYFNARADFLIAKAQFNKAQQAIARAKNLHKNAAISTRNLQEQQSQWQAAEAQFNASRYQYQSIRELTELNWGKQLTNWALSPDYEHFSQLIDHEQALVKITLAPNHGLTEDVQRIYISRTGQRSNAERATFLSPAPQTTNLIQGKTYFFLTALKLRTGTHVTAWIPQQQQSLTGVNIPFSAVIRHLGESFIYLQSGAEHFTRRKLSNPINSPQGYFIQTGLTSGENLVITGAQMLLSEEFRQHIPDEDDD